MGSLIKLNSRSLLRNKIQFARACVWVDMYEPLLEFAEIKRAARKRCGYNICYKEFSLGFSFCGLEEHAINLCPLSNAPIQELETCQSKSPKQKSLVE